MKTARWYKAIRKANSNWSRERRESFARAQRALRTGWKASQKTKAKMSKSHRTRFANLTFNQCKMCTSTVHSTREHKQRLTSARLNSKTWWKAVHNQVRKSGGFLWKCWYEGKNRICMHSSWEVSFAEKLDVWKIRWRYEPQIFEVGMGNWRGHTYRPDFYLPEFDLYVEIKGFLRADNRRKLAQFRKRYPDVRWMMFTKGDLEMLGIFSKRPMHQAKAVAMFHDQEP